MKLLVQVAKELRAEGYPVIWVFDSFSTLITNALKEPWAGYRGFLSELFHLQEAFLCLPICSSATFVGAIEKSEKFLALF